MPNRRSVAISAGLAVALIGWSAPGPGAAALRSAAFFAAMTVGYYGWAALVLGFGWSPRLPVAWLVLSATAVPAVGVGVHWATRRSGALPGALLALAAGIPLAASISFSRGGLSGAPISSTAGHLVVIVGFTSTGNVIVNDPAAPSNSSVRRVYDRWAAAQHGPLTRRGASFPQTAEELFADLTGLTLAVDADGEVLGYAAWLVWLLVTGVRLVLMPRKVGAA